MTGGEEHGVPGRSTDWGWVFCYLARSYSGFTAGVVLKLTLFQLHMYLDGAAEASGPGESTLRGTTATTESIAKAAAIARSQLET